MVTFFLSENIFVMVINCFVFSQEVYTCILTQLVLHTDHTRASVLDADALPAALHMLRQGPW